ncbi:SubName: Full=Uncharacterized protein {ECO:0000313/EMBL:CCA77715.1} [Serendipita indica DSM 11827]|nr:SubName: Full=Uncharacterized protein {ECO:0000313/EMBL:CCA77715.1} [Serendipita indica DSM 11827]
MATIGRRWMGLLTHLGAKVDFTGSMTGLNTKALEDYNNVVAEIERSYQASTGTITVLPDEILVPIFESFTQVSRKGGRWTHTSISPLSFVCKRWQRIIIGTPSLWSIVVASDEAEDALANAAVYVQLSRDHPLTIIYDLGCTVIDQMALILAPHYSRVKSILLQSRSCSTSLEDTHLQLLSLPNLERLEMEESLIGDTSKRTVIDRFMRRKSPLTNRLSLGKLSFSRLISIEDKLRALTVSISSVNSRTKNLRTLGSIDSLKDVTILGGAWSIEDDSSGQYSIGDGPLSWDILQLPAAPLTVTTNLSSRCTALRQLEVTIKLTWVNFLLDIITDCRSLQFLGLKIILGGEVYPSHAMQFPADRSVPTLRSLHITYEEETPTLLGFSISFFTCALLNSTPFLWELRIEGQRIFLIAEIIIPHIKVLKHLKIASLYCLSSGLASSVQIERLQSLQLRTDFTIISNLHCDTVEILDAHLVHYWRWRCTLSSAKWPRLRSLKLRREGAEKINIRLEFLELEELVIEGFSIISAVLYSLARHPTDLPCLQRLSLRGDEVEWDMLFIVLEKRILAQKDGVSPLDTLEIHGRISPFLQYDLINLVGGRLFNRTTNYELSVHYNHEILFDDQIPGCASCHYRLIACNQDVIPGAESWGGTPPPYPETVSELLKRRARRMDYLISVREHLAELRQIECPAASEMITLTRYSTLPPLYNFDM